MRATSLMKCLFILTFLLLTKNAAGQEYKASVDSTDEQEVVPEAVVQQFRHATRAIRDSMTCIDCYVFWFTGTQYGKRYYSVSFSYSEGNGNTNHNGSVHFEEQTSPEQFAITELTMPVKADTLPVKIRRIINGPIKRHCRKYNKKIDAIVAFYQFSNGKLYSVRSEVSLTFEGGYPDYFDNTDFGVACFVVRSDGRVHALKKFPYRD